MNTGALDAGPLEAGLADVGCVTSGDCPDDGNPCTAPQCGVGGCLSAAVDGAPCEDGEPCTSNDRCAAGACKPGPEVCACRDDARCKTLAGDDACLGTPWCDLAVFPHVCRRLPDAPVCATANDTTCARAMCDPTSGACAVVAVNGGATCSDGDVCTAEDRCVDGSCKPGKSVCECDSNEDCPTDEDLCTATYYCDTSKPLHVCRKNLATEVICATADVGPCKALTCDPKDGACKPMAVADQAPCDDGDACTTSDTCVAGVCKPGVDVCACNKHADCDKQEDGDLCNGVLYCDVAKSVCVVNVKTIVTCATGADQGCVKNLCNPKTGTCAMTAVKPGTPCDDGDACTSDEVCVGGGCGSGTNTCPCASTADCKAKEDGNSCNGSLYCNQQTKSCELDASKVVVCKAGDDTACAKNACVHATGDCVVTPVEAALEVATPGGSRWEVRPVGMPKSGTASCDDGDPCTLIDLCLAGSCKPGAFGCACKADADCPDDGDQCNGLAYCAQSATGGVCKTKANSVVVCKTVDDTACLKNVCQPKKGTCAMTPLIAGSPCSDGSPCTKGDYCVLGACTAGTFVCDCEKNADCSGKEDGNQCNGTLYCDKTDPENPACKLNPATVVVCPKAALSVCQSWTCNPTSGQCLLIAGNEGKSCNDGDACTTADACSLGQCGGEPVPCDDGDVCTADVCLNSGKCSHVKTICDDGNSCTLDVCGPKDGVCVSNALANNGKLCDGDSSGCTVNDVCDKGVCKIGTAVSCPKGQGACVVGVCASLGGFDFKCVTTAASDGATCDDGDSCSVTSTCVSGSCKATGKEVLYTVEHQPEVGDRGGYRAVAAFGVDGAVAGGQAASPASGAATWSGWWIVRVDAGGSPLWHGSLASAKPHAAVAAVAVRETSSGGVLAVGSRITPGGDLDATVAAWSSAGKPLWSQSAGLKGVDDVVVGAQAWPTGGFVAAGWQGAAAKLDGVVTRVSGGGQVVWRTVVGAAAQICSATQPCAMMAAPWPLGRSRAAWPARPAAGWSTWTSRAPCAGSSASATRRAKS